MKKFLIVPVLALVASPVLAQEGQTFSGPFIGAQTGWQNDKVSVKSTATDLTAKTDGWMYGAQAGYDWRFGQAVVGLEAMISGSSGTAQYLDPTTTDVYKLNAGTTWGISSRVGYVVAEPLLLYGRFGYTWASYNYVADDRIEESFNQDGILVGLGAEYQFSPNISTRLEWNYGDFGSNVFQRPAEPGTVFAPQDLQFERMGISLGVNFRF